MDTNSVHIVENTTTHVVYHGVATETPSENTSAHVAENTTHFSLANISSLPEKTGRLILRDAQFYRY